MKYWFIAFFLFYSCGKAKITIGNESREYLIHVPDNTSGESPLLLVLHGNPSNGWQMKMWTGMNSLADEEGFIVVYPYAKNGRWPINPLNNSEEIKYIKELVGQVSDKYPVDKARVYLAGISGGGIFSFQLIKELPDFFAAFAVVSGNMPFSYSASGFMPTPFMYIHGTQDFLYPGRPDELWSAGKTLQFWQKINQSLTPDTLRLEDLNKKDGSRVEVITYTGNQYAPIVYYSIVGGGHHWPGASFDANLFYSEPLGSFNRDLDANSAVWQFVSQFSLNKKTDGS